MQTNQIDKQTEQYVHAMNTNNATRSSHKSDKVVKHLNGRGTSLFDASKSTSNAYPSLHCCYKMNATTTIQRENAHGNEVKRLCVIKNCFLAI